MSPLVKRILHRFFLHDPSSFPCFCLRRFSGALSHLPNLLRKEELPVSLILYSASLELLVPKEGMLLPGDTTVIPLKWKLRLPAGYFGLLLPLNHYARKGAHRLILVPFIIWIGWGSPKKLSAGSFLLKDSLFNIPHFLLHFTISSRTKPGHTFSTLLGKFSTTLISKFIACKFYFTHSCVRWFFQLFYHSLTDSHSSSFLSELS
jgi:hypothetical protein